MLHLGLILVFSMANAAIIYDPVGQLSTYAKYTGTNLNKL